MGTESLSVFQQNVVDYNEVNIRNAEYRPENDLENAFSTRKSAQQQISIATADRC
jgi:hypothetical protein